LEYLQAKWAAHLPYRQATALLGEVLPLDKGISFGSTRRRILAVGKALDAEIEHDIASQPKSIVPAQVRESASVACVSVAELRSPCAMKSVQERHMNIVAARATFADRAPRLYAYVHKKAPSAGARLDQFLCRSGVGPHERVTVISDDAGEFVKAVEGSQLARKRILDWFHISMKFKAAENSVLLSEESFYDIIQECIRESPYSVKLSIRQE
jgi:hypothetical protein